MATKKRKRFAEGGISEAEDKAAGLKASEGDKVGFFERLRMGNIDQEGSEAYNRFGAGRGKAERSKANQSTSGEVSPNVYRVDSGPGAMADEDKPSTDVYRVDSGPGKMSSGASKPSPARKPAAAASQPTKGSSAYRVDSGPGKLNMDADKSYTRRMGATAEELAKPYTRKMGATEDEIANYKPPVKNPNYSNEGRGRASGRASVDQIPTDRFGPVSGERVTGTEFSRNAANTLAAMGPGKLAGVGAIGMEMRGAKSAGEAVKKASDASTRGAVAAQKRAALKKQAEEGIERNLADEFKGYSSSAAEKAVAAKQRAAAQQRADKTTNPLAWMAGPKGMADDFKRGGKVKAKAPMKKMASGGSTSKASSRADGIAQRGKTRGKIY